MQGMGSTAAVGDLVAPAVATIASTATLRSAVDALTADRLGLLVVTDGNGMIGVLSERDIVTALADGADLDVERVRDHCADQVVTVDEATSVAAAARTMLEAEIRHLAVARDDQVFGVISVRDLLGPLVSDVA